MLDIQAIRRALAATIKASITRTPNVYAYLPESPALPCIAVTADDPYANYFQTLGMNPECDLRFLVRACASGRAEDAMILIDDLLSAGTGTTSSIVDAIRANPTLDGLVEACNPGTSRMVPLGETNAALYEGVVPVEIWLRQDY